MIRAAIRELDERGTVYVTLITESPVLRRAVPVFEPQPPAGRIVARS